MVNSFKVQLGTYTAHVVSNWNQRPTPSIHSTATDRSHSISSYRPTWMRHSFYYTIFCQWQSIKISTHLLFESGNTNSDCLLQKEPTYKRNEKSLKGRNTVCSHSQNQHSVISTEPYQRYIKQKWHKDNSESNKILRLSCTSSYGLEDGELGGHFSAAAVEKFFSSTKRPNRTSYTMGTRKSSLGVRATGMWSSPLTFTWSQDKECLDHYYTHSPISLQDVLLNVAREHLYLTDIKHTVLSVTSTFEHNRQVPISTNRSQASSIQHQRFWLLNAKGAWSLYTPQRHMVWRYSSTHCYPQHKMDGGEW
jgi:hypothetical protein